MLTRTTSVAEIAKKPLYRVTCGDIGTEAADVEKYLETVLYLGKIWDCGMPPHPPHISPVIVRTI